MAIDEAPAVSSIVEVSREVGIATIYLNRPEAHNALNRELVTELRAALIGVAADPDIRVVVLRGRGKSFSAGADLKEAGSRDRNEHNAWTGQLNGLFEAIRGCPVPVIAAVHGNAIGAGCTLVLMSDYVVLSRSTKLGFPELRHGLTPGMTLPQLRRLVGARKAMDLILTGAQISADEAVQIGIASEAVDDDDLDSATHAIAATIAGYDPDPVRTVKRLARAIESMSPAAAEAAGTDAVVLRRMRAQAAKKE